MLKMTLGQGPLSQKQIELVRVLIQDDRRVTYDILEVLTSLVSRESLEWIIHDHLGYNKIASRWIPHLLTPQNRQKRLESSESQLDKSNNGQQDIRSYIDLY